MICAPALCELCEAPSTLRVHDGCRERLDGHLKALPGAWRALALFLTPAPATASIGRPTRDEAPLPVRLDVLDLRARGGIERLAEWERDWRNLLGWSPAPFRGTVEQTITGLVVFLRNNLLWACDQHPAIRDFNTEVRQVTTEIASVINPPEPSRRLGYCPSVDESGTLCGAVVRLAPGQTSASCSWCGASWGPERWIELRLAQEKVISPVPVGS